MNIETLNTQAKEDFKTIGFPTNKHENWLYWTPDTIQETLLNAYSEPQESILNSDDIIIKNSRIVSAPEQTGLTVSYDVASLANEELSFNVETSSISLLNSAQCQQVVIIKCNKKLIDALNVRIETNPSQSNVTVNTKIIVIAEADTAMNLTFFHQHHGNISNISNTTCEFIIKKQAQLDVNHVFKNQKAHSFFHSILHLYEKSKCQHLTFVSESTLMRHDTQANFYEEDAHLDLKGMGILQDQDKFFNHLKINHYSKNCFCKQHFKSILTQDAISEFSGLVYVAKGSHGVDSQQLNQNLLFSDSARVLSRPQLKIDADDVQCAHGSTIGQLNPEEIHYIKSRGLTEQEAKSLLTFGFAEEIINEISHDTVKKELTSVVKQIIGSLKVTDEK